MGHETHKPRLSYRTLTCEKLCNVNERAPVVLPGCAQGVVKCVLKKIACSGDGR